MQNRYILTLQYNKNNIIISTPKLKELLKVYHQRHIRPVINNTFIVLNKLITFMRHRLDKFVGLSFF